MQLLQRLTLTESSSCNPISYIIREIPCPKVQASPRLKLPSKAFNNQETITMYSRQMMTIFVNSTATAGMEEMQLDYTSKRS